jgi:hypothetical protein
MGRVFYCTREEVMDAFDVKEAADRSAQIDSAIASASDDIDGWLNRHKHGVAPRIATRYFNWPTGDYSAPHRLWFDENELISSTTFTAGGVVLAENTDYFLEPVNSGPPYTYAEINLGGSSSFRPAATGTAQRAISVLGTWGISDDQSPAGSLAEALDASETDVDVTDASLVGVGSVLLVESERMLVTGRSALTTGQVLASGMNAAKNDQTVDVADGTQLHVGETLIVDSERMRVTDITGNNATVTRAYDGTTLAAHALGATVYALRTLTVTRGALGSTAATHSTSTAITKWAVPDLIRDLCRAEAITRLEQEFSAYGARVYSDEAERDSSGTEVVSGRGLTDIRKSCARRYKRKFRVRAV